MTNRNAASMPVESSDWTANGYHGSGNVQELLGSIAGRAAIVCGSGVGVFEQFEEALDVLERPIVFACNDIGQYLLMHDGDPPLDHWVSLHADNLGPWRMVRGLNCRNAWPTKYHSVDRRPGIEYIWDRLTPCFVLSGYFAMQLAYIMGATQIVLCGCPGDGTRRFFESTARKDFDYNAKGVNQQLIKEMARLPEFKQTVRSLSGGFTEEFFGRI